MRCLAALLVLTVAWSPTTRAEPSVSSLPATIAASLPLAVTVDEFNEDGAPDLVGAYRRPDGTGLVVVWPGRPDALVACSRVEREPFSAPCSVTATGETPDLVATGDFDNDGHRDVAIAAHGALAIDILTGNGRGVLNATRTLAVPGRVTALTSGDVNLADGLADLVVAVSDDSGARLLVFEGPDGALRAEPESIDLPASAHRVRIGAIEGAMYGDVEVELPSTTLVVVGRNRLVLAGPRPQPTEPPAVRVASSTTAALQEDRTFTRMRLNGDAIDDDVRLVAGASEPQVRLSSPAATFTVTSALDSGPGTLRDAIDNANANEGPDEIDFAIGTGPQSIVLDAALPEITDPVTIDGTSQPGFAGRPLINVGGDGTQLRMVRITAGQSVLRAISVTSFASNDEGRNGAVVFAGGGSNRVEGCVFGTNEAGDELPCGTGVAFEGSSSNTVGGAFDGARNVFGWCILGVVLIGEGSGSSVVQNNVFGTNAAMDAFAQCSLGVLVEDNPRNLVGGVLPGEGNVVVNCYTYGIDVISVNSAENLVQGNFIGITPDGRTGMDNYVGVDICGGASNGAKANLVGGTAAGASNRIVGNRLGVVVGTEPIVDATENRILCNEIDQSREIGIDLGMDQISMLDDDDTDVGSNDQQNAPVLESLEIEGDQAMVTGRLSSAPNEAFRIELFSGSSRTQAGYGGGGVLVGTVNVTTDSDGNGGLAITIPGERLRGESVVATATDASGDTSEFSISLALDVLWEAPDPNAGANPPPRNPSVRVQEDGAGRPGVAAGASPRALTGYKVYRGTTPDFAISPANLFQSLPPSTMLPTFVLGTGAFFRITACYDTGESAPTGAIPGGVPPVISSAVRKGQKVVITGTGFAGGVVVFASGLPFVKRAKVKDEGTRVIQKNPVITGEALSDVAARLGFATIQVRNASGGSDLARIAGPVGRTKGVSP